MTDSCVDGVDGADGPLPAAGLPRLIAIVERLRAPDGCPWDRRQTLQTMRGYLLEETYEVLEAIDGGDASEHSDELGDLLFQIVFQARLQQERGEFAMDAVIHGICDKLERRHPHVFGDEAGLDGTEVAARWEVMKQAEGKGSVHDVPRALPALMRAQKVGKRAARVGFDWPGVQGALAKLREEVEELEEAIAAGEHGDIEHELGDVLFSAVNIARHVKVDAEDALGGTTQRFLQRFGHVELGLAAQGLEPATATLEQMETLWIEAKGAKVRGKP